MSFEIRLPLERSQLPSPAQWNDRIRAAGFDLVLEDFDWSTDSGFLPARLLGCGSGFELWCDPADGDRGSADIVVAARLGGMWFELVCAMCGLAVLQGGTESPLIDDWQEQTPQEAMAQARSLYNQARIVIEHLRRPGALLGWDDPALGEGETPETRRTDLEQLVSGRTLVRESSAGHERFRLHKLQRQELAAQLQMDNPETGS